jgi:hypothetical protein
MVLTFSASATAATGSLTISGDATAGLVANVSVTTTSSDCYLGNDCDSLVQITLEPTTVGCATDIDPGAIVGFGDIQTSTGTSVDAISLETYGAPSDFDLCMYWLGPSDTEPLLAQATYTAPAAPATTTSTTTTTTTTTTPKPTTTTKPESKLAPVVHYRDGEEASARGKGAWLTINPPTGGCKRQKVGVATLTLTHGRRVWSLNATPCHRLSLRALGRVTLGDVSLVNFSSYDPTSGGVELDLGPLAGHSYSEAYQLRVRFGTTTLLRGTVHTKTGSVWIT